MSFLPDGEARRIFPKSLEVENEQVAAVMNSEQRLFEIRLSSKTGRKAQLNERIRELAKEAEGLSAQQDGNGSRSKTQAFGQDPMIVKCRTGMGDSQKTRAFDLAQ